MGVHLSRGGEVVRCRLTSVWGMACIEIDTNNLAAVPIIDLDLIVA
jgi:hypothetical protein